MDKKYYLMFAGAVFLIILLGGLFFYKTKIETFSSVGEFTKAISTSNFSDSNMVTEADPDVLVTLGGAYTKDSKFVYFNDKKVDGLDAASFEFLDEFFTLDKNGVYFQQKKIIRADPKTFSVFTKSSRMAYLYAKDSKNIYYGDVVVPDADPQTFFVMENRFYGTNGKKVYFRDRELEGADFRTLEVLWSPVYEGCGKGAYSKDLTSVYWGFEKVLGADPATFEALRYGLGRDKSGYYEKAKYLGPTIDPEKLKCHYG